MKKIIVLFLSLFTFTICFLFTSCKKDDCFLFPYVSELRQDIYKADSEEYNIKAHYGFKSNDKNERIYTLLFIMKGNQTEQSTKNISFIFNEKTYKERFVFDQKTNCLTATFEIDDFNLKEFKTTLCVGSEFKEIIFKSIINENVLSVKETLNALYNNQPTLTQSYIDENGKFTAKIIMRIIEKNGKNYYYIGIIDSENNIKAFLLYSLSGEVLAVRNIF
ncbi:MAG: hypothetical protein MJ066_01345 [Clostridia bacterium]|nr:hypothetical protein [Clostridia bacterium]